MVCRKLHRQLPTPFYMPPELWEKRLMTVNPVQNRMGEEQIPLAFE